MLKRTLTSLLLIPPVVYLIGWSPKWLFLLALMVAVALALREYFALCQARGLKVFAWTGFLGAAVVCMAQAMPAGYNSLIVTPLIGIFILVITTMALRASTGLKDYLVATSATVFGILYVGLGLSYLLLIRFSPPWGGGWMAEEGHFQPARPSRFPIFLLFLVIWAGDICAYLVGRWMGRTPFFARISPRKTWEGAMAGLAGSLLAAWALVHWFWKAADLRVVLVIAAWVAVAGQIGDLVESAMKRGANQKDSGTLLPGHGGFLDRIDSLLFAAPALWLAMFVYGFFS